MSRRFVRCADSGVEYRIQSQSRWPEAGRDLRASLEISISNPRCTGRFLECQLAWARSHFDSFEFSLGDTLRVHNYTTIGHAVHGRLPPEAAWRVAREEGDRWLESNGAVIQRRLAAAPYSVVRWDDWKRDRGFAPRFRHLRDAYDAHPQFREAVDDQLAAFLARQRFTGDCPLSELAVYLLEEFAVYQLQAERRPTVNIYAGGMMKIERRLPSFPFIPRSLAFRDYVYLDVREPAAGR